MTACGPQASSEVGELAAAVGEPAQVAPGRAVLEVELDLLDLEPGADGVDRHPRLDAEAHRDGEHGGAGARGEAALPRERLARREAAAQPDQRARRRLREPEAAADAASANAAIASSASDSTSGRRSPRRSASQSRSGPGSSCALGERQRLPLAPARRA